MLVGSLMVLLACGDNRAPTCDPEWQVDKYRIRECPAALVFASRDTADLLPSQAEVDRYFDRWKRATSAEPLLSGRIPQTYRGIAGSYDVYTTNPSLIDAWSQPDVPTGDIELDKMFARIDATIDGAHDIGASYRANLRSPFTFNEEFVATALLARASWMREPEERPRGDGKWVWLDTPARSGHDQATAMIDFRVGWGDCLVACDGFRYLQAIVPADGTAAVYDLGGTPLPDGWSLSPNTKPRP